MIQVYCNKRRATVTERELLTTGSVGIEIQFTFSDDWDDVGKCAVFKADEDGSTYEMVLTADSDGDYITTIPYETLTDDFEDTVLFTGVYGVGSDGDIVIPTVWTALGVIRQGVYADSIATEPSEGTETFWAQVLAAVQKAASDADTCIDAKETVETLAANIEFYMDEIEENASAAASSAVLSQSWAIGNTGVRSGENTNNSKYYATQASAHVSTAQNCANIAEQAAVRAETAAEHAESLAGATVASDSEIEALFD